MRHLLTSLASLAAVCALIGCGAGSSQRSSTPAAANRPPTTTARPADAAAISRTVKAVFEHPIAGQCSTAMTETYAARFFADDATRSDTTPIRACRVHQAQRARMASSMRAVTVDDVSVAAGRAHATVRGANGYPIGVTLIGGGRNWRLDVPGAARQAPGRGTQVSPSGSIYAYRIPPGFATGGTRVGPVTTSGDAFSTGVGLPGGRPGEGIAVAQTAYRAGIHGDAALRAAVPQLDREVRAADVARRIGRPVVGRVGGRPALSWDLVDTRSTADPTDGRTTFVFSSAANVVVVNCRWPQAGAQRQPLLRGCDAVLSTLAVG